MYLYEVNNQKQKRDFCELFWTVSQITFISSNNICMLSNSPKQQLPNYLQKAETCIVLIVLKSVPYHIHCYSVAGFLQLALKEEIPERLYLGQ